MGKFRDLRGTVEIALETTLENFWDQVLERLQLQLSRPTFETWIKSATAEELDDKRLVICTPNTFARSWIQKYYLKAIADVVEELLGHAVEIHIFVRPGSDAETLPDSMDVLWPLPVEPSAPAADQPASTAKLRHTELNHKYVFSRFVVGATNRMAHAASLAVAESPGREFNPLFLCGGVGLGKTHLMHAIGHSIKQRNSGLRVSYITSEKFMNELINAIRYDKTQSFREKYRSIDVLLMDDVQFMAGKERTQEEFFHTFNQLHNDQKQIVITSDCPPRDIPTLEERLHSRFEWGLIADIEPPDLETKVAILKRKADLDGIFLSDEIAMYIAGKIRSNVRELEGSLVRLVAISSLRGVPISKMLAQDAMKNIIDSERPEGLTMDRIARTVASHYKMTVEELKSKNNSRAIAVPRQVAMYLCKRLTKHSYPEVGREFGGKHHTTVMHSFEKVDALIKEDSNFHRTVSELIDVLCG